MAAVVKADESSSEEEQKPLPKKQVAPKTEEAVEFDDWENAIDVVADAIVQTTKHTADVNQPEESGDSDLEETKTSITS